MAAWAGHRSRSDDRHAAEPLDVELSGHAKGPQPLGGAVLRSGNQRVHQLGDLVFHEERTQIALALRLEPIVKPAIRFDAARPVIRTVALLRAAHEVTQRED